MLLLAGVLLGEPSFAEDEFYDDAPPRKAKKKKKGKKKSRKAKSRKKNKKSIVLVEEVTQPESSTAPALDAPEDAAILTPDTPAPQPEPTPEPEPAPDPEPEPEPEPEAVPEPGSDADEEVVAEEEPEAEEDPLRKDCLRQMLHHPERVPHRTVELRHVNWSGRARINTQHKLLVRIDGRRDTGDVIVFTDQELTIDWDLWDEEHFVRQPSGEYVSDQLLAMHADDKEIRRARRVATRLRSKKAISSTNYGWVDRLLDFITGNKPPLVYQVLSLNNKSGRFTVRFCEEEMVVARTKNGEAAGAVLDYTGVKLHIRWEDGTIETYKRTNTGGYRVVDDWALARQLRDGKGTMMQSNEEDSGFTQWWRDFRNEEKPLSYTQVRMFSGGVDAEPMVCQDNRILVYPPPHNSWAKIVEFTPRRLHIRWHNKTDEVFERTGDYVYRSAK